MVGCVLMASGAGRRFGSNKLLSAVEGVPLHRRAMAALAPAGFGRLVVCSPYPEVLSAGAEYGFRPLDNPGGQAEPRSNSRGNRNNKHNRNRRCLRLMRFHPLYKFLHCFRLLNRAGP